MLNRMDCTTVSLQNQFFQFDGSSIYKTKQNCRQRWRKKLLKSVHLTSDQGPASYWQVAGSVTKWQQGGSTANSLPQLWANGCLPSLTTHPTAGTDGGHLPSAGFSFLLQTRFLLQSLCRLASAFRNKLPWVLYGDLLSFITSRQSSMILLFLTSYHKWPPGTHSPDFNNQAAVFSSLTRNNPSKNHSSFGGLCHSTCMESRGELVRASSTRCHQTQVIMFTSKYGTCFSSWVICSPFPLLLRWGLVYLRMASNSLWR